MTVENISLTLAPQTGIEITPVQCMSISLTTKPPGIASGIAQAFLRFLLEDLYSSRIFLNCCRLEFRHAYDSHPRLRHVYRLELHKIAVFNWRVLILCKKIVSRLGSV